MKNYKLQLSENYTLRLKLPEFDTMKGLLLSILSLADQAITKYFYLFVLVLFSCFVFSDAAQVGYLSFFYTSVLILLGLHIVRKIVAKGSFLPAVPYDVVILSFTTVVAISLFATTVSSDLKYNIWGGPWLRIVSGASLISYWFFYYIFQLQVDSKAHFTKLKELLAISPLLALVINLFLGNEISNAIGLSLQLLIPAWLFLAITQAKHKKIYALTSLLSLVMLYLNEDKFILGANIVTFALLALVYLAKYYKDLGKRFNLLDKNVDSLITRKTSLKQVLQSNFEELYFVISALVGAIGLIWLKLNTEFDFLLPLTTGLRTVSETSVYDLFVGKGLILFRGTLLTQLIHSFGILALLLFVTIIVLVVRDLIQAYKATKDSSVANKGTILFLLSGILGLVVNLVFYETRDLSLILLWFFLAMAGVHKALAEDKDIYKFKIEVFVPKLFSEKRKLWNWIQLVSIVSVVVIIIYLIIAITNISSFLV